MSRTASGWVRARRSLLPLRSCGQSLKRSVRKSTSASFRFWICVPMAPSSTRMRFAASRCRAPAMLAGSNRAGTNAIDAYSPLRGRDLDRPCRRRLGAQPDQMADRIDEIGAVHGVEVNMGHALVDQVDDLLGADGGGDEAARGHVVLEAGEALGEPAGDARALALGKAR